MTLEGGGVASSCSSKDLDSCGKVLGNETRETIMAAINSNFSWIFGGQDVQYPPQVKEFAPET